ncbi:MAG TPA: hypothetical protein VM266_10380 [Solirubrobacteraceae bacterium]|nr:hypothetical protein [Solirubrobacteraceae bacterium]
MFVQLVDGVMGDVWVKTWEPKTVATISRAGAARMEERGAVTKGPLVGVGRRLTRR